MEIINDFHIHSRYSRACSRDLSVDSLEKHARPKGVNLLGTGDFTHPLWLKELKQKLNEDGTGILKSKTGFNFILSAEVSSIYGQDKKVRRIHNLILAPDFETVDKINSALEKRGANLKSDGRPIFGIKCPELVEMLMQIDERIEVVPAHCLLPDEKIHCNPDIKKISEVKKGEKVLTHLGNWKEVEKVLSRDYVGNILRIQPYYFRIGIRVTPEHPFFAIKSEGKQIYNKVKNKKDFYSNKRPDWVCARDLKIGDILLYPRSNKIIDKEELDITEYIQKNKYKTKDDCVVPLTGRQTKLVNKIIKVNKDFCRLIGYYLAEGYFVKKENSIRFCFSSQESEEIRDVEFLIKTIFGVELAKLRNKSNSIEMVFFSKVLVDFFSNFCYKNGYNAQNKQLPFWMLGIHPEKQGELLYGWWIGDTGNTTSRVLMNQMKIVCLRLGIIPSIAEDSIESFEKRGNHKIGDRIINAKNNMYIFSHLSFFEDKYCLLNRKCFSKFKAKEKRRYGWIDSNYVYLPIREVGVFDYNGKVFNLHVKDDNSYVAESAVVHNCWTPWFGLFGSKSGFDSVEECFQDQTKHIHALETGLSSDPAMNWRLSKLDKYALVSNSDAHSFWPWRMGREVNVFDLQELNYDNFIKVIRAKDRKHFLYTVEVNPSYGKYHFDGHRNCNVCMMPQESKKHREICPVCRKQLTVGVLSRVEELADRQEGFRPENAIPYKSIIPLSEIIAALYSVPPHSKVVWEIYNKYIKEFGSELNVLLKAEVKGLKKIDEKVAELIVRMRENKVEISPGFDGEYGKLVLEGVKRAEPVKIKKQKILSDY